MPIDFEAEGLLEGTEGKTREARLELLEQLADDGVSLEELKEAVAEDRLTLLPVERVLGGDARYSATEVAEMIGEDVDFLARQREALGFPRPDPQDVVFGDADVEAARMAKQFRQAGLPEKEMLEVARVIGMSMASLAAANAELFRTTLMQPGDTERDLGLRYARAAELMMPMIGPMLEYTLRAHQREQARQAAIGAAELEAGELPGGSEVAVSFADMVGFTKLGERLRTDELGQVASRLGVMAAEVAKAPVRLVKLIGDAAMLVAPDPVRLLEVTLDLVDAADNEGEGFPQLRAGVAFGEALPQGGDWYGRPVNLASRTTGVALPGSVLATAEMRDAAGDGPFNWSSVRPKHLKGIDAPVKLYRVRRA